MAKKPKTTIDPVQEAPKEQPMKRPVGRPTKFDPNKIPELLEAAKNGASKAKLAVILGIHRDTLYDWTRSNPEFSDIVKQCEVLSQVWWEDQGMMGMTGVNPEFNATAFIFQVKNRFRGDYMDTSRTEITGKDGGAVQIEAKVVDVEDLDDEQLALLEAALLTAKDRTE